MLVILTETIKCGVQNARDILEREAYKLTKDFLNVTMKQHNKTKGE